MNNMTLEDLHDLMVHKLLPDAAFSDLVVRAQNLTNNSDLYCQLKYKDELLVIANEFSPDEATKQKRIDTIRSRFTA